LIANRDELNALFRLWQGAGQQTNGRLGEWGNGGAGPELPFAHPPIRPFAHSPVPPLPIRLRLQLPYAMLDAARDMGLGTGFGDEWLRIGAIKIFSDGSLGARTAALREDYTDDPGNRGQLIFSQEELDRRVQAVADAGFQVAIHAIGDAALESVLLAFERCRELIPLPRVEHASLCPPDLITRMPATVACTA